MKNHKKKLNGSSIVLFVIAGLLLIYTLWGLKYSMSYIFELFENGQLTYEGNEFDIVNFYMANSAQYALYAVILIVLGKLLQNTSTDRLERLSSESIKPVSSEVINDVDEEDNFEDWLSEDTE